MIFQWYIFAIIVAVWLLSPLFNQVYTVHLSKWEKKIEYRWMAVLFIMIPLIYFAGMRGDTVWSDTPAYRALYDELPSSISGLADYFTDDFKDKGFIVFSVMIKHIAGDNSNIYFSIIAAICLICVIVTYKKYSSNFIVSILLFVVSADYLQWTYNGIRQFIPVAILFACAGLIARKKYVPVIILIILLSSIHATALLMLPVIFIVSGRSFNKKTLLFLIGILLAIGFIDHFTNIIADFMQNSQYSQEVDQFLSTEGTSIQRVIVYSVPSFLAILLRKRIIMKNDVVLNVCVNMSLMTSGIYLLSAFSSGLFLGRLSIYFSLYNYILLPWEIETAFDKKTERLLYVMMISFYLIYYVYQTRYVWKIL